MNESDLLHPYFPNVRKSVRDHETFKAQFSESSDILRLDFGWESEALEGGSSECRGCRRGKVSL